MILIYYRDKDGAIFRHHAPPGEGLTLDQLQEMVQEYNKGKGKERDLTAYVVELEDDGLPAYLARKAAERKKFEKEIVQDAISSIEDALDSVRSLEG